MFAFFTASSFPNSVSKPSPRSISRDPHPKQCLVLAVPRCYRHIRGRPIPTSFDLQAEGHLERLQSNRAGDSASAHPKTGGSDSGRWRTEKNLHCRCTRRRRRLQFALASLDLTRRSRVSNRDRCSMSGIAPALDTARLVRTVRKASEQHSASRRQEPGSLSPLPLARSEHLVQRRKNSKSRVLPVSVEHVRRTAIRAVPCPAHTWQRMNLKPQAYLKP